MRDTIVFVKTPAYEVGCCSVQSRACDKNASCGKGTDSKYGIAKWLKQKAYSLSTWVRIPFHNVPCKSISSKGEKYHVGAYEK